MAKRGRKRKYPKGSSYYSRNKNSKKFKAMVARILLPGRLAAAEKQLVRYTKLVKQLRLKVKK